MKIQDLSPSDFVEFLEDLRLNLILKDCINTYIDTVIKDLGCIFFSPQEAKKQGLRAMPDEMQEELMKFIRKHKPGKNIIATLLIFWFSENSTIKIAVTQKLIEEAYWKCGIKGNIYQQFKDYGLKGKFPYIREVGDGIFEMTEDGRIYIAPFIEAESVEEI